MSMIPVELYPNEYLRVMRMRLEMTQAQFAKELGVARGTVVRYEIAENKISPERLEEIKRMVERAVRKLKP